MSQQNSPAKNNPVYFYVETTSEQAVSLIEAIARVDMAIELLKDPSFELAGVKYEDTLPVLDELRELERRVRSRMRSEILQPNPVRVSKHLANKIREQVEKEKRISRL